MFIYNACITLYLARRYTQIIVSRLHLFLGEKLLFFSVAWGKLSTLNPERFLSTRRIVRLLFDEGKQLERNEARDSGEWLTKMTDKSKLAGFPKISHFFQCKIAFIQKATREHWGEPFWISENWFYKACWAKSAAAYLNLPLWLVFKL